MWQDKKMPLNTPADVAKYIIQVTAEPQTHGKALFVTGGNAVDIEQGLAETQPQWLGEKNSKEFNIGQEILGLVSCALLFLPRESFLHLGMRCAACCMGCCCHC